MKTLLVERNAEFRATIRDSLAQCLPVGGEILECSGGEAAIEKYRSHRPDWVVMDIALEGMDGLSATKQIMSLDTTARVIIFSQFDDQIYRRAASAAGAVGYILKENLRELARLLSLPIEPKSYREKEP